jgi:hypothetical protein
MRTIFDFSAERVEGADCLAGRQSHETPSPHFVDQEAPLAWLIKRKHEVSKTARG